MTIVLQHQLFKDKNRTIPHYITVGKAEEAGMEYGSMYIDMQQLGATNSTLVTLTTKQIKVVRK